MKHLALLALPFSLCLAQEPAPEAATPAPQPAATAEQTAAAESADEQTRQTSEQVLLEQAKPHLEVAKQYIVLLNSLGKCLKSVTDADTADAAANTVDELAQRVKATMELEQSLPVPSAEVQYLVTAETASLDLEELTNESIGRAIELQEAEPACYGSGALEQAISALLSLFYLQDEEDSPVPPMAE